MTDQEFQFEIQPILKKWQKCLSTEQLDQVFGYTQNLRAHEFRRIVRDWLDSQRHSPLPKDFREAALGALKGKEFRAQTESRPLDFYPKCQKCNDYGLVEIISRKNKNVAIICCDCEEGTRQHEKEADLDRSRRSKGRDDLARNLPQWSKDLEPFFEIQWQVPYSRFWYRSLSTIIKTVPGALQEMLERHRKGIKFTGIESQDFDFLEDAKFYERRRLDPQEILSQLIDQGYTEFSAGGQQ